VVIETEGLVVFEEVIKLSNKNWEEEMDKVLLGFVSFLEESEDLEEENCFSVVLEDDVIETEGLIVCEDVIKLSNKNWEEEIDSFLEESKDCFSVVLEDVVMETEGLVVWEGDGLVLWEEVIKLSNKNWEEEIDCFLEESEDLEEEDCFSVVLEDEVIETDGLVVWEEDGLVVWEDVIKLSNKNWEEEIDKVLLGFVSFLEELEDLEEEDCFSAVLEDEVIETDGLVVWEELIKLSNKNWEEEIDCFLEESEDCFSVVVEEDGLIVWEEEDGFVVWEDVIKLSNKNWEEERDWVIVDLDCFLEKSEDLDCGWFLVILEDVVIEGLVLIEIGFDFNVLEDLVGSFLTIDTLSFCNDNFFSFLDFGTICFLEGVELERIIEEDIFEGEIFLLFLIGIDWIAHKDSSNTLSSSFLISNFLSFDLLNLDARKLKLAVGLSLKIGDKS